MKSPRLQAHGNHFRHCLLSLFRSMRLVSKEKLLMKPLQVLYRRYTPSRQYVIVKQEARPRSLKISEPSTDSTGLVRYHKRLVTL